MEGTGAPPPEPPQAPEPPRPPAPPRSPSPPAMPAPRSPSPPAVPVQSAVPSHQIDVESSAPEGQRDLNRFNDQQEVDTRPCANCGGQLEFHIETQQLQCPHCGSTEAIVHGEDAAVVEQSYAALAVNVMSGRTMTHAEGEKEIVCQNCGGHTTFIGTLTSTRCPYCATPIQRTDVHDAPDRLQVDGVLPFHVSDDAAREALKAWINKRWFAPNEFKKYSTAGSFESVYSAYFTYDASATTRYTGERGTTHTRTVGSGKNRRTETYTVWNPARGTVYDQFDDITILANTGFTEKYVHKLEPWPTQQVQPFNTDYMAGHLSRTYDRDVEQCFIDARRRMEDHIDSSIRRDIGGDKQRIHQRNINLSGLTYKHVLLPIWLLTVIYEGKPLQVFVNGATGEVHGERPWSKHKIVAAVAAVVLVIIILLILRSLASG